MPYVNFFPVVVDRRNESGLIPSNVKNREFSNLVSVGKKALAPLEYSRN